MRSRNKRLEIIIEMPMRVRFAFVSILLGVVCQTSAQTITPPYENDVTAYEHFFAHVVCILTEHCFVGSPPTAPPLQRAFQNVVLTDQEAESLKAIAVDYERKNAAFLTVVGPLRSEARFQSIDSGQVSEELAKRITTLDSEHDQMVADEIKRLKEAFGSERFEVLHSVVTAKDSK
jgi:hypothetical protein